MEKCDHCSKISINKNPILILHLFYKEQTEYFIEIYILFRNKISEQLLEIIDDENGFVNYKFFNDCERQCEIKYSLNYYIFTIDRRILNNIISEYKNFDKIIRIKNNTIKYITHQKLINM